MSGNDPFPITRWSLVYAAGAGVERSARDALADLLIQYRPVLLTYLTRYCGMGEDEGEDLVQGFIADKVVADELVRKASHTRGRFRNFLLRSLEHYRISSYRRSVTRKRSPQSQIVSITAQLQAEDPRAATDIFAVAWARQLIERVIEQYRKQCEDSGGQRYWTLFELRILRPALDGTRAVGYADLIKQLSFESPREAMNALNTAKRQFSRLLREEVAQYVRDPAELEDEVADLFNILSGSRMN